MSEFDILLRPINALHPSGKDLTYSSEFDGIQKLREFDDPTLDQGEWVTDLKVANWPEVVKRCSKLLREESKDLRVAGWLTEGWVYTQGFAGLAQGYSLIANLSECYWDSLFPSIEDGDLEQRIGSLAWVLKQSLRWMVSIPVVSDGAHAYTLSDYASAQQRSGGVRLGESEHVTMEQLDRARAATPMGFYRHLWLSVQDAVVALEALETKMDSLLGGQAPGFGAVRDALEAARDSIQRFAKEAGVDMQTSGALSVSVAPVAPNQAPPLRSSAPAAIALGAGIASREDALARLREVADYFRFAEPHSPVAYMADQAAQWGEMSLHEWLGSVLRDDAALPRLERVLGVQKHVDG